MNSVTAPPTTSALHAGFLQLLPRLQIHGRVYFRHLKCRQRRQDTVAEMTALAW